MFSHVRWLSKVKNCSHSSENMNSLKLLRKKIPNGHVQIIRYSITMYKYSKYVMDYIITYENSLIMCEVVVRVKQGQIQGIKETYSIFGSEFYSFYGIPYAEPPIKQLRFKDPVKVQPWKGIRKATSPRDCFIQYSLKYFRLMGCEDASYVNIHTPQLPREGEPLKAVIVHIHPGSLEWGSPNPDVHGSPNYVMHHDVVYVNIGFRLNILGFLNLNLPECAGNQGLKDIVMAFQWIRENIKVFNGDPSNITVLGGSCGASFIHLLLLSPTCKGLFHKAVIMGQYVFNCMAAPCEDQTTRALEFASELGFKGEDPKKLLKFLKRMPAEILVLTMHNFQKKITQGTMRSFVSCPFGETTDSTILPTSPRQLISSMNQMPILFGICERESIIGFIDKDKEKYEKIFDIARPPYCENIWGWPHNLTNEEVVQLNNEVHSFYSEHLPKSTTPLLYKIEITTDAAYSEVYDTLIDLISPNFPVYVYKFQYESNLGVMKNALSKTIKEEVKGTFHCDDMNYFACTGEPKLPIDRKVINNFAAMICSFAKTSNPNYENIETQWRPTTLGNPCYLSIKEKLTLVDGKLNGERFEFWDRMKNKFRHD